MIPATMLSYRIMYVCLYVCIVLAVSSSDYDADVVSQSPRATDAVRERDDCISIFVCGWMLAGFAVFDCRWGPARSRTECIAQARNRHILQVRTAAESLSVSGARGGDLMRGCVLQCEGEQHVVNSMCQTEAAFPLVMTG